MEDNKVRMLILEEELREDLKADFDATLSERVKRYINVKPHEISPDQHFAVVSGECAKLYRDGHFYGCIALTQAVAEALVRFLCERNRWRPVNRFERNVEKLRIRTNIPAEMLDSLLKIWENRDDYHHLNRNIETDRHVLNNLAQEKARLLTEVEGEVFHYTISNGKLAPKYPKYWDITGDQVQVFLRLEP